MGVLTQGHTGSCDKRNHHAQIAIYFILLTSPDNKVSDTTRKKVYMHIFMGVQVGTPQRQVTITAGQRE